MGINLFLVFMVYMVLCIRCSTALLIFLLAVLALPDALALQIELDFRLIVERMIPYLRGPLRGNPIKRIRVSGTPLRVWGG